MVRSLAAVAGILRDSWILPREFGTLPRSSEAQKLAVTIPTALPVPSHARVVQLGSWNATAFHQHHSNMGRCQSQ